MDPKDVVRAWKDPEYRSSLDADERSAMPSHPSGLMELDDADLMTASGGTTLVWTSCPCATIASVTTVTNNISCWGSCDNSVSDGTCDLWSLGCCDS
jgi:mersacidin/lichenicidin family type 2 lantibiotic